ncbi:unnamed protein product, partial [Larinioides sclopetarius]
MASSIFDSPLPLRGFSQLHISQYMLKINEINEDSGACSCLKSSIAGMEMFRNNFVNSLTFSENLADGTLELTGLVKAEMKKITYKVDVCIDLHSNEILSAECKCAGGAAPSSCKHVFTILSFVEEYCVKELYNAPTEILQQWHKPSKKKRFPAQKISEFIASNLIRPTNQNTSVNFEALSLLKRNAPIFSVVNDGRFDEDEFLFKNSICLPVIPDEEENNPTIDFELSLEEILFLHSRIKIDLTQAQEIEKKTVKQQNDLWKVQRLLRLTASNFYRVVHRRNDLQSLSQTILEDKNLDHIPAIRHGKIYENKVKNYVAEKYTDFKFRDVGLVINPKFYFLGASPDGLLHGKDSFLVEVKCTYNKENLELDELCLRPGFCLENKNGVFHLKRNHQYYYQIQGQMAMCNLKKCLFVLLHNVKKEPYIEEIQFN